MKKITPEFIFLIAVTLAGWGFNYGMLHAHYEDTKARLERVETRLDQAMLLLAGEHNGKTR